jgi:hypothetical protein
MKRRWEYQETIAHWSWIGFGSETIDHGGWHVDEKEIHFFFWSFCFISSTQMDDCSIDDRIDREVLNGYN